MTINLKNFLKDKRKLSKMGEFQELQEIDGLEVSAVSADLYGSGRDDLALFYFKEGANYAAVYTNNSICSESITWNKGLRKTSIKALMVNTKNANTFTGIRGAQGLKEIAQALSKQLTLKSSQSSTGVSDVIKLTDLLFASTGVIGEEFPYLKIKNRVPELVKKLKAEQNTALLLLPIENINFQNSDDEFQIKGTFAEIFVTDEENLEGFKRIFDGQLSLSVPGNIKEPKLNDIVANTIVFENDGLSIKTFELVTQTESFWNIQNIILILILSLVAVIIVRQYQKKK